MGGYIANKHGLLSSLNPNLEASTHLICVTLNAKSIYPDSATSCELASFIKEGQNEIDLSIFPNPFHTTTTFILNPKNKSNELKVYNLMGELIIHQIINSSQITLSRDGLNNGIYIINISNKAGGMIYKKIIVE